MIFALNEEKIKWKIGPSSETLGYTTASSWRMLPQTIDHFRYIKIQSNNKRHNLEALGTKYKDLYEFIPQSLEMMPFALD